MRLKLFVVLLFLFFASSAFAQTVAIRAGNLIDPAHGTVAKDQIILVKDTKITDVGPNVAIPKDAIVVDLSHSWVMPGIMDAHTHITSGQKDWDLDKSYLHEDSAFRALRGLKTARVLLYAGITTVRDVGNDANFAAVDLRKALEQGWFDGPTVLTAGKIIAPYGGQSGDTSVEMGPYWRFEYIDADGPEEIRKAVREDLFQGADLIKLVADNSKYFYSLEEIRAAAEEAHRAGVALAVHVLFPEPAKNVINGGADSVEHGFFLTDEVLQLMKQKGTVLVGTDFPWQHFARGGFMAEPQAKHLGAVIVDRLHRAYKIGVKMGFGTDIVIDLPDESRADMTWDYLNIWRLAGVPAMDLLKCMTTNDAELLRIDKERGAISAGLFADIIAMPDSPLDDTEALRKINFVMKNGKIIRRP
ncbi:MAG TPA: amidohydrolase family protein [Candidatus Acidoferrales bacterium]|nr:amidohydrolase family protein [Candidatus Acidoferrales bacterium]